MGVQFQDVCSVVFGLYFKCMYIESYIWPYVEILHGDYDFRGIFVDLLSEDMCGHESTLHIFLQQAKLIILLEEQQFNSKVLGLDVLAYLMLILH